MSDPNAPFTPPNTPAAPYGGAPQGTTHDPVQPTADLGATQPLPTHLAAQAPSETATFPVASPYAPPRPYDPAAQYSAFGTPTAPGPVPYPAYAGPGQTAGAGAGPTPSSPSSSRSKRSGPGWAGVGVAAAVAALLASLATAGLTGAFSEGSDSSSYAALGDQQISIPVSGSTADNPDWQVVAAAVRDSVVAITVRTSAGVGQGSGVILSSDGMVLTNHHVISGGENGTITVSLADGRLYKATIVGSDPTTDIAVLRLTDAPDDLVVATFGDSSQVVVGAAVMAVGNPLGLDSTVTTGIISAVDRPVTTSEDGTADSAVVTNAIQVDAAINPGNSGGPLFNSAGEVIGITSSIASMASSSSGAGSIGLGFAIPINYATAIADQLIATGTAEHAFLGVSLQDGTATADGTTRSGAAVAQVSAGTPAQDAGIQVGDVVVGIDGKAVSGAESLTGHVRQHASGDKVTLTIVRDGKAMDVSVTLATKPTDATSSGQVSPTPSQPTPSRPSSKG